MTLPAATTNRRRGAPWVIRKKVTKGSDNPYLTSATPDDLGPADRIAYGIVVERRDLLPSVERVMSAGLEEDDTVGALTLFRRALSVADDPNRDQRVAIAVYVPASADADATAAQS